MPSAIPDLLPLLRQYLLLLACCLCGWCSPAAAATPPSGNTPIVQSMDWWLDRSGQADLGTVQQVQEWTPFTGWKSWGYGPEPVWVRLRLRAGQDHAQFPWIAHIRPAFLDDLTLYDPATGLKWHAGDTVPMTGEIMGAITFTFRISELAQPRDLYLRVASTSARVVNADVLTLGEARRQVRLQEWLYGFATSMSFIFVLWALIQWWQTRDRVIGIFAVKQTFATLWAFFTLGFARVVFDGIAAPGVISAINNTLLGGAIASAMWFMKNLFAEYRPRRFAVVAMVGLGILALSVLLLQLMGMHWQSLLILNALIPISLVVLVLALVSARGHIAQPTIRRRWLLAYLALYAVLNSIPPLTYLGVLGQSAAVDFGNLAYVLMDGMVMLVILHIRAQTLAVRQQAVEQALLVSEEQARLERQHREDQGQLLAMLAHEVKTPLATMRMWMDAGPLNRDAMERAIADMNRVIERCVHTGQLGDQGLQPSMERIDAKRLTRALMAACRAPDRVDLQVPSDDVLLSSDPQMLSIVLANLLDNACKYGASGSRIVVDLSAATNADGQPGWCWEVRNAQGPTGAPEADQLFVKYYRGKQARRQSGSGLGLFLIRNLLVLLKGEISYVPKEGEVVFRVWLPA